MNNIKQFFTIKDLENLSNIKAHTIRIWEKRYHILSPYRTESNIRYYDNNSLKKLLNISYLNERGIKISKLALLSDEDLILKVKEINAQEMEVSFVIDQFIIAMLTYDEVLFQKIYKDLQLTNDFRTIFKVYLLPLLYRIGLLWQTGTIIPAQEHFISNLVRQKLYANIENLPLQPREDNQPTYILYTPLNEIHEIGLLYIHYELLLAQKHTIYLGTSIAISHLETFLDSTTPIAFISSFTVDPSSENVSKYLEKITKKLLTYEHVKYYCASYKFKQNEHEGAIKKFTNYREMLEHILV